MTKASTPAEMSIRQSDNTNNATKNFDYTAVADREPCRLWGGLDKVHHIVPTALNELHKAVKGPSK